MVDQELVRKKLNELRRYVKELERFQKQDVAELRNSLSTIWSVEHGLQLAIQIVIDVGNHILAAIGENRIEDYVDVIDKLGERGAIPKTFAQQIRDMAGFRNVLVHEYVEVDLTVVHQVLRDRLSDFATFIQHIEQYLKSQQ